MRMVFLVNLEVFFGYNNIPSLWITIFNGGIFYAKEKNWIMAIFCKI